MAKLTRPRNFKDTRQLPSDAVMTELGRIAIVSASIEDIMHSIYWKIAGISDPVGTVITGDARATRLAEDIVRIARAAATDVKIIEDLKDIFTEHRALVKERNKFLHWIWSWNTKTSVDRIDPPAYKPNDEGKYVKPKDIAKVGDDLVWIEARLSARCCPKLSASVLVSPRKCPNFITGHNRRSAGVMSRHPQNGPTFSKSPKKLKSMTDEEKGHRDARKEAELEESKRYTAGLREFRQKAKDPEFWAEASRRSFPRER